MWGGWCHPAAWGGAGAGWWGFVLTLVFWGLLFGTLIWAAGRFFPRARPAGAASEALDVLRLRYARGEISREEFEAIKTGLK